MNTMVDMPLWTVLYNIDSGTDWVGTGWEFFKNKNTAKQRFDLKISEGHCPTMRPFNYNIDRAHMGAVHKPSKVE